MTTMTLAECAREILDVAEMLSNTVYAKERMVMPEPIARLGVVAGALADIERRRTL